VKQLRFLLPLLIVLAALLMPVEAMAQAAPSGSIATTAAPAPANGGLSIDVNGTGLFTDRMVQIIALITVLSVAPPILIMMTSFVRIVVVLSLLRTALGLQTSPPNSVLVSLAMFLTLFVMSPTLTDAYNQGLKPMMAN
jgi:flagellar biosynthetic protein FliP